jgi:SAM-dependent methyltransferase
VSDDRKAAKPPRSEAQPSGVRAPASKAAKPPRSEAQPSGVRAPASKVAKPPRSEAQPSEAHQAAFDYEAALWGEDRLAPGERSIAGYRLAEALVHLPRRGRVLEVGCGGGRYLRALRELRPELALVGADVSRTALARLAAAEPAIETRLAAGDALPAADGEFDAVLVIDVLEHVPDPDRLLAEVHRVLAPGGVLHLHVPCEGDPRSLWRWLPGQSGPRGWKRRFGGHLHRFRRGEILRRVEAAGFSLLRVRNSLHLVGNAADVAVFAGLALANRRAREDGPATTGDVVASRHPLVRAVDALIHAEARLLARVPSWSIHLSAVRAQPPHSSAAGGGRPGGGRTSGTSAASASAPAPPATKGASGPTASSSQPDARFEAIPPRLAPSIVSRPWPVERSRSGTTAST